MCLAKFKAFEPLLNVGPRIDLSSHLCMFTTTSGLYAPFRVNCCSDP